MAATSGEDYLAVITQLIAEKDRLVAEKDELVISKDKLWREMYQMLREQIRQKEITSAKQGTVSGHRHDPLEIQQLHEEISRLKRRNADLEEALRDALETDEDGEDDDMGGQVGSSEVETRYVTRAPLNYMLRAIPNDVRFNPRSAFDFLRRSEANDPDIDRKPLTPTSLSASLDDGETMNVESIPPTSVKITPVIKSLNSRNHTFGQTRNLEPSLLELITKTINALACSNRFASASQKGNPSCAERHISSKEGSLRLSSLAVSPARLASTRGALVCA